MLWPPFFYKKPPFAVDFHMQYGGETENGGKGATATTRVDRLSFHSLTAQNSWSTLTAARGWSAAGVSKKSGGRGFCTAGHIAGALPAPLTFTHDTGLVASNSAMTGAGNLASLLAHCVGVCSDVYYFVLGGITTAAGSRTDAIYKGLTSNSTTPPTVTSFVLTSAVDAAGGHANSVYIFCAGGYDGSAEPPNNIILLESGSGARVWWQFNEADDKSYRSVTGNENMTYAMGGATFNLTVLFDTCIEASNMSASVFRSWGTLIAGVSVGGAASSTQSRSIISCGWDISIGMVGAQRQYFNHSSHTTVIGFTGFEGFMGAGSAGSGSN